MKYTFHIVDVFSSTPFGGNQLAVLPDAVGISTEGMQKIAREFNFGETTFVLPKNDPANTCRVRIFTPRAELDFAGHPTVGTACALTEGISGGPWFSDFNPLTGLGVITGVSAFKYADAKGMLYSAELGSVAKALYEQAQHA